MGVEKICSENHAYLVCGDNIYCVNELINFDTCIYADIHTRKLNVKGKTYTCVRCLLGQEENN